MSTCKSVNECKWARRQAQRQGKGRARAGQGRAATQRSRIGKKTPRTYLIK